MGEHNEPLDGFSSKHGSKADTQGIIMWSDVFLHEGSEKIAIILMDTEGLFEPGKPPIANARIFGVTNLISSIQILNVKENIQENDLEYLEMTTGLTRAIADNAIKTRNAKLFQKLIFLIQDFNDKNIEYGFEGGEILLNNTLNRDFTGNPAVESVRKNIRNSYDEITCFLLPSPGDAVGEQDFDGRWSKIKPNFLNYLKQIIIGLLEPENLVKKNILGMEITGETLREYLIKYFEMFNSENIPKIGTIFSTIIDINMNDIITKLFNSYKKEITGIERDYLSSTLKSDIEEHQKKLKAEIIAEFLEAPKLGGQIYEDQFKILLEKMIEDFYTNWLEELMQTVKLLQKAKSDNDEEIRVIKTEIDKSKAEQDKTVKKLQKEIDRLNTNLHYDRVSNINQGMFDIIKNTIYRLSIIIRLIIKSLALQH